MQVPISKLENILFGSIPTALTKQRKTQVRNSQRRSLLASKPTRPKRRGAISAKVVAATRGVVTLCSFRAVDVSFGKRAKVPTSKLVLFSTPSRIHFLGPSRRSLCPTSYGVYNKYDQRRRVRIKTSSLIIEKRHNLRSPVKFESKSTIKDEKDYQRQIERSATHRIVKNNQYDLKVLKLHSVFYLTHPNCRNNLLFQSIFQGCSTFDCVS